MAPTQEEVEALLNWCVDELEMHGLASEQGSLLETARAMLQKKPRWADMEDDSEPEPELQPPAAPSVVIIVGAADGSVLDAFPACVYHSWRNLRHKCRRPHGVSLRAALIDLPHVRRAVLSGAVTSVICRPPHLARSLKSKAALRLRKSPNAKPASDPGPPRQDG